MNIGRVDHIGWILLWGVLLSLLLGVGCGRDTPQRRCETSEDCRDGRQCIEGLCTFDAPDPDSSDPRVDDAGESDDAETPDEVGVLDDAGPGTDGGDARSCEPCPPWRASADSGCQCEPRSCSENADCGEFVCIDEQCQPCEEERQCPDGQRCNTSGPYGQCVPDPCETDDDCEAQEKCGNDGQCIDRDECLVDDDCNGDETCFNGRCTYSPECESDSDCREGLACIGGRCYEDICRGNDDCEGDKVCNAGECETPPEASRCWISTSDQKITQGERVRLEALAVDDDNNAVPATFEWNSSNPSVAEIGASSEFAIAGSSSGTARITARTTGGVSCNGDATLTRLESVGPNDIRVVVTDARSRTPVSNADVVVRTSGGQRARTTTNGSGVATLPDPGQGQSYTVSVFQQSYNYLTVRGVDSRDIRLPLVAREGNGPVAGFKGQFDTSRIHTSGDVTLGLAGSSITGGLLELGLDQLLGAPFQRQVQTPVGNRQIALASGLVTYGRVAGFDLNIKKDYYTTAPGGTQLGWGLVGQVSGLRLFQIIRGGGNTLAKLLPLFNRFDHGLQPVPNLRERPRIPDSNDIDGDGDTSERVPDYSNFDTVSLKPSVRQNLVTEVSISNFPTLRTGDTDFAMLVGGNVLQSTGFVPLGISATTDQNDDGFPDARRLSMAPPHGPLTGGRYAVMAIAFNTDNFDPGGGFALPDDMSVALWSSQTLDQSIGLGTFPNQTQGQIDSANRRVSLNADAGPIYRVRFVGSTRSWEVWSMGPKGSMGQYQHTVEIPSVSNRLDLFANANKVLVDSIQASVTVDDLIKATGIGLRDLGLVATAFNRTKIQ